METAIFPFARTGIETAHDGKNWSRPGIKTINDTALQKEKRKYETEPKQDGDVLHHVYTFQLLTFGWHNTTPSFHSIDELYLCTQKHYPTMCVEAFDK